MSQASFHNCGGTWALSGANARCCRLAWFRDFPWRGPLGPEWRIRERLPEVYTLLTGLRWRKRESATFP